MLSIFVHIVTYHSEHDLFGCLDSLLKLAEESLSISIVITENSGNSRLAADVEALGDRRVTVLTAAANLGFAGGHNAGAARFLQSESAYFLVLNPDVRLEARNLATLAAALDADASAGLATPLLLRPSADDHSPVIDAAGMVLTSSLRHLDRGSEETWTGQYREREYVFGGTGACLLLKRQCLEELLLRGERRDSLTERLFPQLHAGREERAPLFDEAFFVYREDADLSWRAQLLGWKCLFVPDSRAIHGRRVTPERRKSLPPELNLHSVRNRFLLQLNNWYPAQGFRSLLAGVLVRNLLVVGGALLWERSSRPALRQVLELLPRQLERRRLLKEKMRARRR